MMIMWPRLSRRLGRRPIIPILIALGSIINLLCVCLWPGSLRRLISRILGLMMRRWFRLLRIFRPNC